jgi:CD109 antigen
MAAIEIGDIDFALLAAKIILKFQKSKEKQSTYEIYYTQIAFAKLSTVLTNVRRNLNLHFESDKGFGKNLIINDWTSLAVQKFELPADTSVINISANGTGLAFINIKFEYETNEIQQTKYFELDVDQTPTNNDEKLNLSICVSRAQFSLNTIEGKHMFMYEKMANPIVLEIYLPSGFVYDLDSNLRAQSGFVTVR